MSSKYDGIHGTKGAYWFVVNLPPVTNKRRQAKRRGFNTKEQAHLARVDLLAKASKGDMVEASKETMTGYLGRWLDSLPASGLRPSTVASYRQKVRLYLEPTIGPVRLQALTGLELDHVYGNMQTRGLSLRTVRYTHSIIRKALQDAFRKGLVVKNVADQASPPKSSSTKPPTPDVWTPGQLGQFLNHPQVTGSDHHPLLLTAAMTGMRRGELCGLGWDQIDLTGCTIEVTRNLTITDGLVLLGEPKTRRGRRSIDIDTRTADTLKARRLEQVKHRLAMGKGWQDEHGLVFTMPDGSPWRPDHVSRQFGRLVNQTGLAALPFHGLRHSHATHLLAAGENPKLVSQRLGHSTVAFTLDTYAHVLPGQQAAAAENVARLVFG